MNPFKLVSQKISGIGYLLILATIFYLFISVFTYHPDNKQVLFWASIDGVKLVDVWKVGAEKYPKISQFNYPPAHYVIDKFLYFIARPIAGAEYDTWLGAPNDHDRFTPQLARFALATKTGLILLGILSGYLVYLIAHELTNKKQALLASAIWLFNPITIYSLPMMGQNDVIAICFFLLGWYVLEKKKFLATLFFGIGAAVKMIPIIWLPFLLACTSKKNWTQKMLIFFGSVSIYVASLVPFMGNENFQRSILTGNHNQRFLYAQLSFGFSEAVYIIPILLMLLLTAVFTHTAAKTKQLSFTAGVLMLVNMTMLSFTHFHPQWWIWVVLFWALWIPTIDAKKIGAAIVISLISFICWLVIVLLFNDKALSWGLLMPLNPNLVNLPTIRSFLEARGVNIEQLVNLAYTWLAGTSILSIALLFKNEIADIHENILIPQVITKIVRKIYTNTVLRKLSIFLLFASILLGFSLVSQIVPAPLASRPPDTVQYQPLVSQYRVTIDPQFNTFNRFDLYLSNTTLQGKGSFNVEVFKGENHIYKQTLESSNIGFESIVRFDIPGVENISENDNYTIQITPTELLNTNSSLIVGENTIQVGVTDAQNPHNTLAIRPYFANPSIKTVLPRTLQTMQNVVWQSPVFFILLILSILFLG